MTDRDLIVLDIETTGLNPDDCQVLEIAAIRMSDSERLHIVPKPVTNLFGFEDAPAFAINRYFERRVWEMAQPDDVVAFSLSTLREWLNGNTLGGSNPRFDLAVLNRFYYINGLQMPKPHHRLADLAAFTAGHSQALKATELPGLADVCSMLGVTNEAPHSAMGDAEATLACFRKMHEVIA